MIALYKNEIAEIMQISASTLATYLNKQHFATLALIGYRKHSQKIVGEPLKWIMQYFCITETDIENYFKKQKQCTK